MKRGELIRFELNQAQKIIARRMGDPPDLLTKCFYRRLKIEKQATSTINSKSEVIKEHTKTDPECSQERSSKKEAVKN